MNGQVLIGSGYYTHEQLSFGKLIEIDTALTSYKIERDDLEAETNSKGLKTFPLESAFVILLGTKGITRLFRKSGLSDKKNLQATKEFLEKIIPPAIPLVVVDDFSFNDIDAFQNSLMTFLKENFNLKVVLVREFLRGKEYPPNAIPFSLPCDSYKTLRKPLLEKKMDLFFQGNTSSKERKSTVEELLVFEDTHNTWLKTTDGGIHNTKERLDRNEFLKKLSESKLCLSFAGSGYDCYRYQEIPSVGSVLVSPAYPLIVRNDYEDMRSCLKYKNLEELEAKVRTALDSPSLLEELTARSTQNFDSFHTTEKRFEELKNFTLEAAKA